ncbi:hypothetical protein BJV78DRAFT_1364858 [Lactifluus subvellereus]|nr:hypothetical protein BJV78DRAFT_1364858 [Lactifluus subvellereus]
MISDKRIRKPINGPFSGFQTSVNITQHSSSRGSQISIDGASKTGKKGRHVVRRRKESGTQRGPDHVPPRVTIEALPDIALLDIFEFYRAATMDGSGAAWPWNRLVHVCQIWRYLVFASPLRLDLHLRFTSKTPVREMLNVWPPLPIEIDSDAPDDMDNVIATLEYRDRVRKIWILHLTTEQLEQLAPMMQGPFPALTSLQLSTGETAPVLPDMFLGGSASRLQMLALSGIPFPGLPRLLLSAINLSSLSLDGIPDTGYISPEAMVTCLSALTRLTHLTIDFTLHPDRHPPPLTRVILPALEVLHFRGFSEYLEDLVAGIDAPRLRYLQISFLDQLISDTQQLSRFIGHTGIRRSYNQAQIRFGYREVLIFLPPPELPNLYQGLWLKVVCGAVDLNVQSAAQICNQSSFLLSSVKRLDIEEDSRCKSLWRADLDGTLWLELFRPFTAVRTLHISRKLQSSIVSALRELTEERATEVLPALEGIYLEMYHPSGLVHEAIEPFIAARQYSGHPVSVHGPPLGKVKREWFKSE